MTVLDAFDISNLLEQVGKSYNDPPPKGALIVLTSIALAESGGNTAAIGVDPNDRGLWQWNRKAHPDISDADAFDAVKSTDWVYVKTKWDPKQVAAIWVTGSGVKSKGFDQAQEKSTADKIAIPFSEVANWIAGDAGSTGIGVVKDTAGAVVSAIDAWQSVINGLTSILAHLVDTGWWKRVGIFALGLTIIVIAIILTFKDDITQAAGTAGKAAVLA